MKEVFKCRMCGATIHEEYCADVYHMMNVGNIDDYPDPVTRATMVLAPDDHSRHGRWHLCEKGQIGRCDRQGFVEVI